MQNVIVVTLGDEMSFASMKELSHAIEMWKGVKRVEFQDSSTQNKYAALKAAAKEVYDASKIVFDVSSKAGIHGKQITCPHGNIPDYPTHAWWCDKCFGRLDDALSSYAALLDEEPKEG